MGMNWQPPGQGYEPPGQGYELDPRSGPPTYVPNWGLAQPISGYQPVAWVPRPPRPGVVNLAAALTFLGVAVSAVEQVISLVYLHSHLDTLTNPINFPSSAPPPPNVLNTAAGLAVVLSVVVWLIPAAGAIVTTALSLRGANAARIVLASLMGVFALDNLCGGVGNLAGVAIGTFRAGGGPGVLPYLQLLLAALAIVIGVLVLLPSANRFFSAGPGRRFMPST
jgi:hypothetical protein